MQQVLITDDVHPLLIRSLEEMGYQCHYHPQISLEQSTAMLQDVEGIVMKAKIKATRRFLEQAPKLRWIARLGSGLDNIDLEAAEDFAIAVLSAPEGNCNAVAEHAIGMLLGLLNKIVKCDAAVRQLSWQREANRGAELAGKTIGIIGYGHTGAAFAKKLAGFDVQVLVYDRFKKDLEIDAPYIDVSALATIQQESEIISLHVSLNPSSQHMVDAAFISACNHPFILINTARGQVVKTKDLVEGLQTKKILGACLDVYENEKPNTFSEYEKELYSTLYNFENVVLTPHVAGWTKESKERIAQVLISKLGNLKA
ncbi:MAG: hypothetical protein HKN87_07315 [Saprospiraceae bacterium]|nr:hypothetical protein [Saprospiraceae bacterium]